MKSIRSYDINAHIGDIKSEIIVENGSSIAVISFKNLGCGDITAIKFNAIGYNLFGDVITIDNKEKFLLVIQDILINKNEEANNLKVKLPASDIRKLDIEEAQICLADGSVVTYEGSNIKEIELQEFDYTQQEELSAIHKLYDERFKYKFCEFDEGWICGCGRFNKKEVATCTLCGKNMEKTKSILSTDGLKKLVEEYHFKISAEQEETRLKAIEDKKIARKKKIKIAIGTVMAIFLAIMMVSAIVMSGRTTYGSEAEMKARVAGTYNCYGDYYNIRYQLKIEGDTVTKRWYTLWRDFGSSTDDNHTVESWNPHKGTIDLDYGTIVVTYNGDLKYNNDLYKIGGVWSDSPNGKTNDLLNSDLKITVDEVISNSNYTICTGRVKNNGTKTYRFIEVKGAFKNSWNDVVDTDWTYAAGSEGLAPGESTTFRLSVTKDDTIKSCTVTLLDFD